MLFPATFPLVDAPFRHGCFRGGSSLRAVTHNARLPPAELANRLYFSMCYYSNKTQIFYAILLLYSSELLRYELKKNIFWKFVVSCSTFYIHSTTNPVYYFLVVLDCVATLSIHLKGVSCQYIL